MTAPSFLQTSQGRKIAYHQTAGKGVGVVFLGGFKSDMEGTKAVYLEDWARQAGRPFLRLDYSGHGSSSGEFEDGSIGEWAEDAQAVIEAVTDSPQILVGSSMGGWIALLLAKRIPTRVSGLVGIAAAPDFTQSLWEKMSENERDEMNRTGALRRPSDYSDEPYVFTKKLVENGRDCLIFHDPLTVPGPLHLLQGTADTDVDMSVALRLMDHAESADTRLTLVKDADHRFSDPKCLSLIVGTIKDLGTKA